MKPQRISVIPAMIQILVSVGSVIIEHRFSFRGFLRLNGIQLADTLQGFIRQSRRRTDVHIVDFTAGVSPTSGFRYPAIAVQFVEPGVSIGLQHTAEAGEMGLRVDAFSVGTVREPHCRWQR